MLGCRGQLMYTLMPRFIPWDPLNLTVLETYPQV